MAILKHEFYEGAALHQLARNGEVVSIRNDPPFFLINNRFLIHLKYSTKGRSPWGFTFAVDEQVMLAQRADKCKLVIGLVCGADGIVTVGYERYRSMVKCEDSAVHISCYRKHGQHYSVAGPNGILDNKVPPSRWHRLLENQANDETL